MVSGPPSLLTAAVSFSGTLISRAPVFSAVFPWQVTLVSRSSTARGALNWLGALVSRSLLSPAATIEDKDRRVLRGGSWNDGPNKCRSAYRVKFLATAGLYDIGFRVVSDNSP